MKKRSQFPLYMVISGIILLLFTVILYLIPIEAAADNNTIVLSEGNTVVLNMPILGNVTKHIQEQLLEKNAKLAKGKPIYLFLNSPGGSIDDGRNIIALVKGLGRPVHTISLFSASMSFIISQYLDTRYVLENSTLMSHQASVNGIGGNIPGSAVARINHYLTEVMDLSKFVANRAHIGLPAYLTSIAPELWMTGQEALQMGYADKMVNVRCDRSLQEMGEEQDIDVFIFKVKVAFHKCPLITEPVVSSGNEKILRMMLDERTEFVHKYIINGGR